MTLYTVYVMYTSCLYHVYIIWLLWHLVVRKGHAFIHADVSVISDISVSMDKGVPLAQHQGMPFQFWCLSIDSCVSTTTCLRSLMC